METRDYDVFLFYNSRDIEQVEAIAERLKERGILPWLDVWEIPPEAHWQEELQRGLKSIKSAAVFIRPGRPGPWQELALEHLLGQLTRRGGPIIPVILEGGQGDPQLPLFLQSFTRIDMRQRDPDPFERLVWGITGERRQQPPSMHQ